MDNYIHNVLHHSSFSCHLIKKIYRRSDDISARICRRCRGRCWQEGQRCVCFGEPSSLRPARTDSSLPVGRWAGWQSRNRDSRLNPNPSLPPPPPSPASTAAHHSSEPGKGFVPEGRSRCLPRPSPSPPGPALFSGAAAPPRGEPGPVATAPDSPPPARDPPGWERPAQRVRTPLWREKGGRKGGSIHTDRLLTRSRAPAPDPFAAFAPGISRPFRFTGKILFRVFNTEIWKRARCGSTSECISGEGSWRKKAPLFPLKEQW